MSEHTTNATSHRRPRPRRLRRLVELDGVIERLQAAGIQVTAAPNPLRGISHDSAYVASFIKQVPGPVLAVGHSYGGAVISNAATGLDNVVGLVFVAAFAPDEGERLGEVTAGSRDSVLGTAQVALQYPTPDGAGTATEFAIDPAKLHDVFAADLPAQQAAVMAATQRPVAELAFTEPSGTPAWKSLPSWDGASPAGHGAGTDVVRSMAERAGATITEVEGSHVIMVSRPDAVTEVIMTAAAAVDRRTRQRKELAMTTPALDPGLREGHAAVGDDIKLHYVEAGEGPLVLLLHGFPEFWFSWRLQIAPLAKAGFRSSRPTCAATTCRRGRRGSMPTAPTRWPTTFAA
jgi:pimeloyl-ACP methyl ester carboxylesterase